MEELDARELFQVISSRYETKTEQITFGVRTFSLLAVRDTNRLLDTLDPATFAVDERLPYWADLWPSAIELARSCLSDFSLVDLRVLELGCGLGLAGIAAAAAGAHVELTDYEEDALMFARWNAMTNLGSKTFRSCVSLAHLDWRKAERPRLYDVILGSDIVYERRALDPLLHSLRNFLAPGGYAVFTDQGRETGREFFEEAAGQGFAVERTETEVGWHGRQRAIVRCVLRRTGGRA